MASLAVTVSSYRNMEIEVINLVEESKKVPEYWNSAMWKNEYINREKK